MLPTMRELARTNRVACVLTDQHAQYLGESMGLLEGAGVEALNATSSLRDDALAIMQEKLSERQQRFGVVSAMLVYGDRLDALLAAAWAYERRIPVMHLQAGDISGGVDDGYRMAIAHMTTEHFAPTWGATIRLQKLGIDELVVHCVGDHHLDAVQECVRENVPRRDQLMLVQLHPDTLATAEENRALANAVWQVVDEYGRNGWSAIVLPPCTDRQRDWMFWPADLHRFNQFQFPGHCAMEEYVGYMQQATVFLGNSSSAVIECPFLGLPAVAVGNRQQGRGAWANGGSTYASISKTLQRSLRTGKRGLVFPSTERGIGKAWKATVQIMRQRGYAE